MTSHTQAPAHVGRPLCVDLDGTLTRTDLLWEAIAHVLTRNPFRVFQLGVWAFRGKESLKSRLAASSGVDLAAVPLNEEVVALVSEAKAENRQVVLATASPLRFAEDLSAEAGGFDAIVATQPGGVNMAARNKADALTGMFGERGFDYVGNSSADIDVWRHAHTAVVVSSSASLVKAAGSAASSVVHLTTPKPTLKDFARQLRVHQWAKNVLVLLPLITAHLVLDFDSVARSIGAFISFSLVASAVYVWNDLHDLAADRQHASKRNRPVAAGRIPIPTIVGIGVVFAAAAVLVTLLIGPLFLLCLAVYVVLNVVYSSILKRVAMADVVMLALLYVIRILAGCAAIGTSPSFWLIAFSLFFFFSLALMKRYAELMNHKRRARGRGYSPEDAAVVLAIGAGAGVASVLVAGLYLNAPETAVMYKSPEFLWGVIPLLLYWVTRAWTITSRGGMHDDPIIFALKDRISLAVLGAGAILAALAWVV